VNKRGSRTQRQSRSLLNTPRRRALAAYGLLGLIAVLLVVLLLLFPGVEGGEPANADAPEEGTEQLPAAEGADPRTADPYRDKPVEQPVEEPGPSDKETPAAPAPEGATAPVFYLVIDDVGYDSSLLEPFLELPIPITFAVLPRLPASRHAARRIERAGQEYILHQPMEAVGGNDPGPGAISSKMDPEHIREVVDANLKGLPKARGVNNHMGSKGTAEAEVLVPLFELLRRRELFFLDSRTTAESVVDREARRAGLPFSERNVFLDNRDTEAYVERALQEARETAGAQGRVVMIGHVWSSALPGVLQEWIPKIRERGGRFHFLSQRFEEE
jgi:hypothetical protein